VRGSFPQSPRFCFHGSSRTGAFLGTDLVGIVGPTSHVAGTKQSGASCLKGGDEGGVTGVHGTSHGRIVTGCEERRDPPEAAGPVDAACNSASRLFSRRSNALMWSHGGPVRGFCGLVYYDSFLKEAHREADQPSPFA
jgi:hypothetical protein